MSSKSSSKATGARKPAVVLCEGNPAFDPDISLSDTAALDAAAAHLAKDDLHTAVTGYFGLRTDDSYVYHAMTSVTLAQAQHVVHLGGAHGLHAWYRDPASGAVLPPPPLPDTEAYIAIFLPSTDTAAALRSLGANAKRGSIRASVAEHLTAKRFIHPALLPSLTVPKVKPSKKATASHPSADPYLTFWAWSSRALEWAGPSALSAATNPHRQSHHVLPVLMHHFGCAAPSHEALCVLRTLAAGRRVADVGAGNGYWTARLRAYGGRAIAVDNAQSAWRTTWVRDGVVADGVAWLAAQRAEEQQDDPSAASSSQKGGGKRAGAGSSGGGPDMVLLMVYPIVGGGVAGGKPGDFTRNLLDAYTGDTVAVVGTQNHNGYTGFPDMPMDEFMAKERPEWIRVVQLPLPSFAGKDDALFVFQRGPRAPQPISTEPSGQDNIT